MSCVDSSLSTILKLDGFGVAFNKKVILSNIDLEILEQGIYIILGPGGTGKSTLLRSIVGVNNASPSYRNWGEAQYLGQHLSDANHPVLVSQSAKLMMSTVLENIVYNLPERNNLNVKQQRDLALRLLQQAGLEKLMDCLDESVVNLSLAQQRHLAVLRLAASGPSLLCLDETTTGIEEGEELDALLNYIKKESQRRAILIVLHNLKQARVLGGCAALLAGGYIQEMQPTLDFINNPITDAGKQWVCSGSCCVPSPDAKPEELADDVAPPPPLPKPARQAVSQSSGPRGFLWLIRGVLAGTPLPGVFHDIDYDMKMLSNVGITTLVSLTSKPVDKEVLDAYGVKGIWSAIKDMGAPTVEQCQTLCKQIDGCIHNGEIVAVHCRAGLGRTGTILAAYLIWKGMPALDALEGVRDVEPRWVQSDAQVEFLENFAKSYISDRESA